MSQKSIGLIEAMGLCAGVTAADAAVKSANVKLIGYEYSKGDGMCTVKVEGDVGAVKAACAAGSKAAEPLGGCKSVVVIARPSNGILPTLIYNKENVGGEYHLATGKRPKGQSAGPVLVKRSKPEVEAVAEPVVEEPVVEETPVEEAPIVEEAPVDETPVVTPVEEIVEETPVEEPVVEEPVVEEVTEEPVAEEPVEEVVEETAAPVEEAPAETPAPEVVEEVTEEVAKETPEEAPAEADDSLVVKSTSRGKRGGKRAKSSKKDK